MSKQLAEARARLEATESEVRRLTDDLETAYAAPVSPGRARAIGRLEAELEAADGDRVAARASVSTAAAADREAVRQRLQPALDENARAWRREHAEACAQLRDALTGQNPVTDAFPAFRAAGWDVTSGAIRRTWRSQWEGRRAAAEEIVRAAAANGVLLTVSAPPPIDLVGTAPQTRPDPGPSPGAARHPFIGRIRPLTPDQVDQLRRLEWGPEGQPMPRGHAGVPW